MLPVQGGVQLFDRGILKRIQFERDASKSVKVTWWERNGAESGKGRWGGTQNHELENRQEALQVRLSLDTM